MTITEMTLMKYIYISKLAAINDYFISTTLFFFNIVIIAINIIIHLVTRKMEIAPMYFQHNPPKSTNEQNEENKFAR